MTHGPVEVAFEVYEDFLNYAGGVYVVSGTVVRWVRKRIGNSSAGQIHDLIIQMEHCLVYGSSVGQNTK